MKTTTSVRFLHIFGQNKDENKRGRGKKKKKKSQPLTRKPMPVKSTLHHDTGWTAANRIISLDITCSFLYILPLIYLKQGWVLYSLKFPRVIFICVKPF